MNVTITMEVYEAPVVEVIEVEVEKGFAISGDDYPGYGNEYPLFPSN